MIFYLYKKLIYCIINMSSRKRAKNGPSLQYKNLVGNWRIYGECVSMDRKRRLKMSDGNVCSAPVIKKVRHIPLTRGLFSVVDGEDYEKLSKYSWYTHSDGCGNFYAARSIGKRNDRGHLYMHRVILGFPKEGYTDHINGDKLDNRKKNLRICDKFQNAQNKKKITGSSQYKGVYRHGRGTTWVAQISVKRVTKNIGCFKHEEDAAKAYDDAARMEFGEFARLNFPKIGEEGAL